MIKRILVFTLSILLLFAISYTAHSYFINEAMAFELWQVYLFHAIAALVVYISIEAVSSIVPDQAGYAYLALMLLKIGIFVFVFKNPVFENDALTKVERLALVLPLFLFLIAEVIGVARLLNNQKQVP
ncbi:DUF6168 family protein [Tamlana sp. 2_MG-2023]|uniref:DUF6168 family protein n=1 Tax=unclassified Tamlana TaxID=2614803 RepID=UPI0026E47858|nr:MULTISPECIES: DUF6168 family protein [unclassified Tamlana]MDO6759775.1 DUF6168 family protein [Tamlana sp. 2_MG-2023]MDO6791398.1 DUF6168 family protein [Tamlana sp. 1_MG-2023]